MSPKTNEKQVVDQLADQLEFHWTNQLRPRLDGLTDDGVLLVPGAELLDGSPRRCDRLHLPRAGACAVHHDRVAARARHRRRAGDAQPLALRRAARGLPELAVRHRCGDRAASARRRLRKWMAECAPSTTMS